MVQLHAYEHGASARPTEDIDVLGNSRRRVTERLAEVLDRLGEMVAPPVTEPSLGYRFEIGGQTVELLGPEGLGKPPRTLGVYETIEVPGGSQALRRTQKVSISVAGAPAAEVRRPTLLGAILLKARALDRVQAKLAEHRQDLIQLLTLVHDPRALAQTEDLRRTERQWLLAVESKLAFDDPTQLFTEAEVRQASQAFELLARS